VDTQNYEIRVLDGEQQLLYVMPTGRLTEQAAKNKAIDLLSLYGGESFTLDFHHTIDS
jgi:hypothetical protein